MPCKGTAFYWLYRSSARKGFAQTSSNQQHCVRVRHSIAQTLTSILRVIQELSCVIQSHNYIIFTLNFCCGELPRSRSYGRTAALRLIVQPCNENEEKDDPFFFIFSNIGSPVEGN
jgi:hypothetical protein